MDAISASNGRREGLLYSEVREAETDRMKDLLVNLIGASKAWTQESGLTGVCIDIGVEQVNGGLDERSRCVSQDRRKNKQEERLVTMMLNQDSDPTDIIGE
jgi:hypothetical protein